MVTPVIDVVAGDYFEIRAYMTSAGNVTNDPRTYFALEVVEGTILEQTVVGEIATVVTPTFKGTYLRRTTAVTAINATAAAYVVPWETAIYDSAGAFSASAPTRITIPAGVTKVRLGMRVFVNNLSFNTTIFGGTRKNGSTGHEGRVFMHDDTASYTEATLEGVTPVLDVVAGDYFEAYVQVHSGDTSIDLPISSATAFWMEVVEGSVLNQKIAGVAPDYSTTETDTGVKWIDGKPIYRKVVDVGTLPNGTLKTMVHGVTGVGKWVTVRGIAQSPAGSGIPMPHAESPITESISLWVSSVNLNIRTYSASYNTWTGYVILEYTKA
jgi:hypothetical protein